MVFNFTRNYQFSTSLQLDGKIIKTVHQAKLLGTIISIDLSWDQNTRESVRNAYARMDLIRKMSGFGAPVSYLKTIYIMFTRSVCEQSISVWHSSLTHQNTEDIERIQNVAFKIILKDKYKSYQHAQNILELQSLKDRREELCLTFAKKCLGNEKK